MWATLTPESSSALCEPFFDVWFLRGRGLAPEIRKLPKGMELLPTRSGKLENLPSPEDARAMNIGKLSSFIGGCKRSARPAGVPTALMKQLCSRHSPSPHRLSFFCLLGAAGPARGVHQAEEEGV